MLWEVMSYGERPYWEMSNQDVSTAMSVWHTHHCSSYASFAHLASFTHRKYMNAPATPTDLNQMFSSCSGLCEGAYDT